MSINSKYGYGLGTNYYAYPHPSIGNYFNFASGQLLTDELSALDTPICAKNIPRSCGATR